MCPSMKSQGQGGGGNGNRQSMIGHANAHEYESKNSHRRYANQSDDSVRNFWSGTLLEKVGRKHLIQMRPRFEKASPLADDGKILPPLAVILVAKIGTDERLVQIGGERILGSKRRLKLGATSAVRLFRFDGICVSRDGILGERLGVVDLLI